MTIDLSSLFGGRFLLKRVDKYKIKNVVDGNVDALAYPEHYTQCHRKTVGKDRPCLINGIRECRKYILNGYIIY